MPTRIQQPLQVPEEINHTWSIDFMSDAVMNGRKFRSFHVLDNSNHTRPHDALAGMAPVEFARKTTGTIIISLTEIYTFN